MNRSQICFTESRSRDVLSACAYSTASHPPHVVRRPAVCDRRVTTPLLIGVAVLLLTVLAAAESLTGTVTNSTTGRPAAGDPVILLSLGQGMEEAGRTRADAQGKFSFTLDNDGAYVIRAIHDGVTYHSVAPPGTTTATIDVYDVSKKVDGIEIFTDIMYLRTVRGLLLVTREFGVQNNSNPPRTQMNPRNLEFYVPDGARVVNASAMTENGNPLRSAPVPQHEKNRYSFFFPLRPGLTRFEVTYVLPYQGSTSLDPKSPYPLRHFVVIFPKTMQFNTVPGSKFRAIQFPDRRDSNVEMASDIAKGGSLAFSISGEGQVVTGEQPGTRDPAASAQNSRSSTRSPQPIGRPGGGLGLPIDAPDPLHEYRWWILGGLAVIFLVGGIHIGGRRRDTSLRRTTG